MIAAPDVAPPSPAPRLVPAAVVQANATLQSMASVAAVRLKELQLYPLRTFPVRPPAVPYTVARVAGGAAQYQTCNVAGRAPAYAVRAALVLFPLSQVMARWLLSGPRDSISHI